MTGKGKRMTGWTIAKRTIGTPLASGSGILDPQHLRPHYAAADRAKIFPGHPTLYGRLRLKVQLEVKLPFDLRLSFLHFLVFRLVHLLLLLLPAFLVFPPALSFPFV
ncbi:hypothetical protein BDV27DRAFT_92782 [Aspergillus caelatus]|uniref:Uncharacterized protein n=1 Tax=Aspergillus caelatus TaxID=61420 RepID=A0A5N7A947_9EURO|nr:uncharacterized protein BDV27DRAFT_92782 [Aspergillus caelatus]KAE8366397.1 hypothetical protein BDV27DRAFT_92782 [Aspergillus caelatus]